MIAKGLPVFINIPLIAISMLLICFATFADEIFAGGNNEYKLQMDFEPIPFPRLIGMADLVVTGSVIAVGDHTFRFDVEEFLVNHQTAGSLQITKHASPEFISHETAPYTRGQRFALFLTGPERHDNDQPWTILGIAGEGQIPIENEYIYFGVYEFEGLERTPHVVHGITEKLQRYDLDLFKHAVKNYHDCFSWKLEKYIKNKKERTRWVPSRVCPAESVEEFRNKSLLHEQLVLETMKRIPVDKNR